METGPGRCTPESRNHDHAENIKTMNNNNNNNVWISDKVQSLTRKI